jgi:hypothetical protein
MSDLNSLTYEELEGLFSDSQMEIAQLEADLQAAKRNQDLIVDAIRSCHTRTQRPESET